VAFFALGRQSVPRWAGQTASASNNAQEMRRGRTAGTRVLDGGKLGGTTVAGQPEPARQRGRPIGTVRRGGVDAREGRKTRRSGSAARFGGSRDPRGHRAWHGGGGVRRFREKSLGKTSRIGGDRSPEVGRSVVGSCLSLMVRGLEVTSETPRPLGQGRACDHSGSPGPPAGESRRESDWGGAARWRASSGPVRPPCVTAGKPCRRAGSGPGMRAGEKLHRLDVQIEPADHRVLHDLGPVRWGSARCAEAQRVRNVVVRRGDTLADQARISCLS